MPSSSKNRQVAKVDPAAQQVRQIETQEQHASANASAGLNLNLFAAVSGVFSGRSKKSQQLKDDGSYYAEEEQQSAARAQGVGAGSLAAAGQARADSGARRLKQTDHLGIEPAK
ncbi:hypothetical protein BDY21DRAFT_366745 [Lineolata rhizophorae]|uniref:Uncharacterized protein n=1 Tax=Lineolata rhizophorae TaxID=578093 RepID=A0A6A6NPZ1_9PEZI|nr:hypothetical protein BDY21DRAFT_366745 [Lineolata rhizophorae]